MADIGKLLSPQSVAVVGASSDVQGLRGRILQTILSHPFAGRVYPVSRSATEVQGLRRILRPKFSPSLPTSQS
jgi:acyl-CoA synthetase (NDP forming)